LTREQRLQVVHGRRLSIMIATTASSMRLDEGRRSHVDQ